MREWIDLVNRLLFESENVDETFLTYEFNEFDSAVKFGLDIATEKSRWFYIVERNGGFTLFGNVDRNQQLGQCASFLENSYNFRQIIGPEWIKTGRQISDPLKYFNISTMPNWDPKWISYNSAYTAMVEANVPGGEVKRTMLKVVKENGGRRRHRPF